MLYGTSYLDELLIYFNCCKKKKRNISTCNNVFIQEKECAHWRKSMATHSAITLTFHLDSSPSLEVRAQMEFSILVLLCKSSSLCR